MSVFPSEVRIREVGPRDGLQSEAPLSVDDRVALIDSLAASGLREIEAVSFVSPTAVPAMAGADEVMARVRRADDVSYVALVPNLRGAELALDAGVDGLNVTVSASPAYNEKNVKRTIAESLAGVERDRRPGGRAVGRRHGVVRVRLALRRGHRPGGGGPRGDRGDGCGRDVADVRRHDGDGDAPPGAGARRRRRSVGAAALPRDARNGVW